MSKLFPLAAILALLALATAIASFVANRPNPGPLTAQINRLASKVDTLKQQVGTLSAGSQAGAVSKLQTQMQKLITCIPELQQQLNGMSVSTYNSGGYLTNAYLSNPTIISSVCQQTLNPSTGNH